jgi:pyruvate dehydrogenase E1 component beta subunit
MVNNAAKVHYMFDGQYKAPIVVRSACGGGFGGGPHHSQMIEGWFMNVPGLVIVAPSTPEDAKGLLIASIEDDNPILFLEHKALYRKKSEVPAGKYVTPLRKVRIARQGYDVTIVADSWMVYKSLAAAEVLAANGISAEVIDLRTLRPWDHETVLDSVRKTGRAVVVSESPGTGGLSADVSAVIAEQAFDDLKAAVKRVTALDTPIPFSVKLEKIILPGEEDIIRAVQQVYKQS